MVASGAWEPYSTFCIHCQREIDKYPDWQDRRGTGKWNQV
jgi:hypothetical protein